MFWHVFWRFRCYWLCRVNSFREENLQKHQMWLISCYICGVGVERYQIESYTWKRVLRNGLMLVPDQGFRTTSPLLIPSHPFFLHTYLFPGAALIVYTSVVAEEFSTSAWCRFLFFFVSCPCFFFVAFLLFKSEIGSEYPCGTVWTSPLNCYVQFKDVMYYVRSVYLYISTFNAWEYLCVLYHVGKNPFHVAVLLYLWYSTIYLFVTFEVTCVTFYFPPCGGCGATVSVKKRNMLTRE